MPSTPLKTRLSKSSVLKGLQCPKQLYLLNHNPGLATPDGPQKQAIFDQGTAVGIEARTRFPGGVLISEDHRNLTQAVAKTQEVISQGAHTLFEAAFQHEDVLVRVDILKRLDNGHWQMIEVKSSTKVKDEYLQDVAIQIWVLRGAGLALDSASVMVINNKCEFPNLKDLFKTKDVTKEAEERIPTVVSEIQNFKTLLAKSNTPDIDIGPQCKKPYPCVFKDHCWGAKNIPPISVFNLPNIRDKAWQQYHLGNIRLDQLTGVKLSALQQRVVDYTVAGKRFIDRDAIAEELARWERPLYFLDFETINPAIPRWNKTHSFQQIPFQFSVHIQTQPGGPVVHAEYLHPDTSDPRPALMKALTQAIGSKGSVVSYNMDFEGGALCDMGLDSIADRLVDPWPLVKRAVYDPGFHGSFSIKHVAPALLGSNLSYEGMPVADGTSAQIAWSEMIQPGTSLERRAQLRHDLLEYCKKDTLAMVLLVEWLREQVKPSGGE